MKIAQVAPLIESVPPRLYGGTERVVSYLTEELVRLGHDVIDKVRERADEFDILHFHIDLFHFPLFRALAARTLTTLHGRQDLGDLKPLLFPLRRNAVGFHLQ
jgi:glycosyltransferase involved in cell wall biosynthesis